MNNDNDFFEDNDFNASRQKRNQMEDEFIQEIDTVLKIDQFEKFLEFFEKYIDKALLGVNKKDNDIFYSELKIIMQRLCPIQSDDGNEDLQIPIFIDQLILVMQDQSQILQFVLLIFKIIFKIDDDERIQESSFKTLAFLSLRRDVQQILLISKQFHIFIEKYFKNLKEWNQIDDQVFLIVSNILSLPSQYQNYSAIDLTYAQVVLKVYQFYINSENDKLKKIQKEQNAIQLISAVEEGKKEEIRSKKNSSVIIGNEEQLAILTTLEDQEEEINIEFSHISNELTLTVFSLPDEFLENRPNFKETFLFLFQFIFLDEKPILQYKSLILLNKLCLVNSYREYLLHDLNIMNIFDQMLERENSIIKREVFTGISNLLKYPNDTILWLKFDSQYAGIDSANNIQNIVIKGNPQRIAQDKGLYGQNWGINIRNEECIYLCAHGLELPYTYFLSCWFFHKKISKAPKTPTIKSASKFKQVDTHDTEQEVVQFRTLFAGNNVPILQIDPEEKGWILVDDNFKAHLIPFDFQQECKHGWNLVFMNVDNNKQNIELWVNSKSLGKLRKTTLRRNITEIGNNQDGDQPMGQISDLRIYNRAFTYKEISEVHYATLKKQKNLIQQYLNEGQFFSDLLQEFKEFKDGQDSIELLLTILQLLCFLASSGQSRIHLIKVNFQDEIIKYLNHSDKLIKMYATKAFLHLV